MSECSGSSGKARLGPWGEKCDAKREACIIGDCSLYGTWVAERKTEMSIYTGIKDANSDCPGFCRMKIHSPLRQSCKVTALCCKEQRPVYLSAPWIEAVVFTEWSSSCLPFTDRAVLLLDLWRLDNCSPCLSTEPFFSQSRATWEFPGSFSATSRSLTQLSSYSEWARSSTSLKSAIRSEEASKGRLPTPEKYRMLSCCLDKWLCLRWLVEDLLF